MPTTQSKPVVQGIENQKVTYERRSWFLFSWYTKVKTESLKKEVHIISEEPVDLYLNGVRL